MILDAITHKGSQIPQKEQLWRLIIHLPVGGFCAWLCSVNWVAAVIFAFWFYHYERNEDKYLLDRMWIDLKGALFGLALGIVIIELL